MRGQRRKKGEAGGGDGRRRIRRMLLVRNKKEKGGHLNKNLSTTATLGHCPQAPSHAEGPPAPEPLHQSPSGANSRPCSPQMSWLPHSLPVAN
jgi:hypothetical protein